MMNRDSDGHWAWAVVNAGFAVYDGYKAYKKHGWKASAIAGGTALVGGVAYKVAKSAYKASKTYRLAKKVAKKHGGTVYPSKGNGWRVNIPDGKKRSFSVGVMNKGSGKRPNPTTK